MAFGCLARFCSAIWRKIVRLFGKIASKICAYLFARSGGCVIRRSIEYKDFQSAETLHDKSIGL